MVTNDIDEEYKIAFSEVDDILYFSGEDIVSQIPSSFIRFIKENKDENYISNINPYLSFDEQEISDKARAIIALIYRSYIASSEEKDEFKKDDKAEFERIEKEKKEKYNPDQIFKDIKKVETAKNNTKVEEITVVSEKGLLKKNIK